MHILLGEQNSATANLKANDQNDASDWDENVDLPTRSNIIPWWSIFENKDIVALDSEHVTKTTPGLPKNMTSQAATVDIVNFDEQPLYSTKIYHPSGSFLDHHIWKRLTGFNSKSFASKDLPTLQTVRSAVKGIITGKLVITIGGDRDFESLGLNRFDFEIFDLQDHFCVVKTNEKGVEIREPHSLRSLSTYYLGYNPQANVHNSATDAIATMQLFKVYCQQKKKDDPLNVDSRSNRSVNYNHVPIVKGLHCRN
jgi:hypothetical protein